MIRLKVKQILQEKNKTAYWLSKQTGISANNIGKICNGETTNIRFDTMEKICKALNCTPNELMETDDPQLNRLITYATYLTIAKDDEK
nr:MAG TPA: Cro/C1-type HTH DNA-binding domain protein [Caudoviricetes sp.]